MSGHTNQYVPLGAGSVVQFEDYGGIAGGSDYHRSAATSLAARFTPDVLARSARAQWAETFAQDVTPHKPKYVSTMGSEVWGERAFTGTRRNQFFDRDGEYAYRPEGSVPEGASQVSWAPASVRNTLQPNVGGFCGSCAPQFVAPSTPEKLARGANSPRSPVSRGMTRTPLEVLRAAFLI